MGKITAVRGDTIYRRVTLRKKDGTPYTLQDGEKIYFTVAVDNTAVIQKEFGPEDLFEGIIIIKIEPLETASLALGTYVYDIRGRFLHDDVSTPMKISEFELTKEVTTLTNMGVV